MLFLTITVVGQGEQQEADTFICKQRQLSKCVTLNQKYLNVYTLKTGMQITFLV